MRDTGLLHALLRIETISQLQGHPALGSSWEAYILQEIITRLPPRSDIYFYRTHEGTEADVVITLQGIPEILIEIKYSTTPKPSKGFFIAQNDLSISKNFIICPVSRSYLLTKDITVLSHNELNKIFEYIAK
ncbi:MAG: DUF4143 domain-containing protein [Saprospiraceae bacterium]|nr:DUF4143 domain-containing protein [Candidatus Vicinibacter affinis]